MRKYGEFSVYTHIDHDCVIVHDPQPLPLIDYYQKIQPWIWRCHVDLSAPNKRLWDYFKNFLLKYDKMIVSNHCYLRGDIPVEQQIVLPAIDPLSSKNIPIKKEVIDKTLNKFNIKTDKPIITQISRFDKWKGTPVVASNIGGIPLQIKNGKNGFLFEPDDLNGFADRIIRILKDSKITEFIGKNAIEYVRENFLITRLLSDYLTFLCEFWNGNSGYN